MSQQYQFGGSTLTIPGSYSSVTVERNNSGLSSTGVLALIGESSGGPDHTAEDDISLNYYGANEAAAVVAKYKSGPIVDAFRAAVSPSTSEDIQGAPSRIYILKTNPSVAAAKSLTRAGLTNYGSLTDTNYGILGNGIYCNVTASTSEVAPTTGLTTYIPSPTAATMLLRVNGAAQLTQTMTAFLRPNAFAGLLSAQSNGTSIVCTGGEDRTTITGMAGAATLTIAFVGTTATITASADWTVQPDIGDTLVIPDDAEYGSGAGGKSVIAGAADANCGAYIVTGKTSQTITAIKIRNNTGAYDGALTTAAAGPAALNSGAGQSATTSILCYKPIKITNIIGTTRSILSSALVSDNSTLQVTSVSTNTLVVTISTGWANIPSVNDLLFIPNGSIIKGADTVGTAGDGLYKNHGWYTITAATSTTISATRLSDYAADWNPQTTAAINIDFTTDLQAFRPVVDGVGKSMEIRSGGVGGEEDLANNMFKTTANGAVTWISSTGTPTLLTSATEYKSILGINRQSDSISDTVTAGGEVVLKIGYIGTTATFTVGEVNFSTTVVGGSGTSIAATPLANFATLSDLATYINSLTGYSCQVANALYGQLPSTCLDQGTFGICSTSIGVASTTAPLVDGDSLLAGRIKKDAYEFYKQLGANTSTVYFKTAGGDEERAIAGLPEVMATGYLTGGAKNGTCNAVASESATLGSIDGALTALESINCNFIIPLFSRSASGLDITDGLTESVSTYTIDYINAAVKTHVLAMSKLKRRKNRQAFLSNKTTFALAQAAANNIASARCSMAFQDYKNISASGSITQFQPWMGAALAAGMQAAGFYRAIFNKGINCSGVIQAAADFSDQNDTQIETALQNGMLVARRAPQGGFRFVSDQTTYATDSNFVYNSIQAIYAADTIALTIAERMENAFVGQSVADISASVALSFLKAIMFDLKRLKLIATSDDAPLGFKNATVNISGPAMIVSLEVKLAGAIYFIPINVYVSQVEQAAS